MFKKLWDRITGKTKKGTNETGAYVKVGPPQHPNCRHVVEPSQNLDAKVREWEAQPEVGTLEAATRSLGNSDPYETMKAQNATPDQVGAAIRSMSEKEARHEKRQAERQAQVDQHKEDWQRGLFEKRREYRLLELEAQRKETEYKLRLTKHSVRRKELLGILKLIETDIASVKSEEFQP